MEDRLNYAAFYRLNMAPPADQVRLLASEDLVATLLPGPFAFSHAVPVRQQDNGSVAMLTAIEERATAPGCYLAVSVLSPPGTMPPRREDLALPIAELVATLELAYPLLVEERVFEGALVEPGHVTVLPEGPIRISTPWSLVPDDLSEAIVAQRERASGLPREDRTRLQLAARWFLRGLEARNPVDRFLYFFISLEIFPARGSADVVRSVRELLARRVYPELAPDLIMERTKIGRIVGLRARIVHDGLAFVDIPPSPDFEDLLQKLEAVVTVSMRLLAGLPPGPELDLWVRM